MSSLVAPPLSPPFFQVGQVVWAKLEGFPHWPAKIVTLSEVPTQHQAELKPRATPFQQLVCFLDSNQYAHVKINTIKPFLQFQEEYVPAGKLTLGEHKDKKKQTKQQRNNVLQFTKAVRAARILLGGGASPLVVSSPSPVPSPKSPSSPLTISPQASPESQVPSPKLPSSPLTAPPQAPKSSPSTPPLQVNPVSQVPSPKLSSTPPTALLQASPKAQVLSPKSPALTPISPLCEDSQAVPDSKSHIPLIPSTPSPDSISSDSFDSPPSSPCTAIFSPSPAKASGSSPRKDDDQTENEASGENFEMMEEDSIDDFVLITSSVNQSPQKDPESPKPAKRQRISEPIKTELSASPSNCSGSDTNALTPDRDRDTTNTAHAVASPLPTTLVQPLLNPSQSIPTQNESTPTITPPKKRRSRNSVPKDKDPNKPKRQYKRKSLSVALSTTTTTPTPTTTITPPPLPKPFFPPHVAPSANVMLMTPPAPTNVTTAIQTVKFSTQSSPSTIGAPTTTVCAGTATNNFVTVPLRATVDGSDNGYQVELNVQGHTYKGYLFPKEKQRPLHQLLIPKANGTTVNVGKMTKQQYHESLLDLGRLVAASAMVPYPYPPPLLL